MKNTKKKYVNEDIDGYKEENQSPLAPAWLFSGKQNEGKVLTGGPNGFVVWGQGGGSGGTTDYDKLDNKPQLNGEELIGNTILTYNNLTNKPQLNGVELAGNITFPYVKTASVSGNTLTLTLIDSNQQETSLNFEINIELIKNAVLAEIANDYYTKDAVDNKITTLQQSLLNLINEKTSAQQHYLKNKSQLVEGQNISLIMNDDAQTITFDVTETPEPPEPTADGIYSFDTTKKIYRKYNPSTIFAASGDIEYCEGDQYNNFPDEYDKKINRQIFNEPIFFIFKQMNETEINELFQSCLANCQNFNYPLDFQDVDNLSIIGGGFLTKCVNFNSTITFKDKQIIKIGDKFMLGCTSFNNKINNLFTSRLKEIRTSFLEDCYSFNQDLDFSQTNLDSGAFNKIMLVNFMYNCSNFTSTIKLGDKTTDIFKKSGYDSMYEGDMGKSFGNLHATALSYIQGIKFTGTNISKEIFDNFIIFAGSSPAVGVKVFENTTDNPYKKIIVNGVA